MEQIGLVGVILAATWLVCTGVGMALWPERAVRLLRLTATSRTINNVEQGLRLAVGLALLARAPASRLPLLFEAGGWFIILSSLLLLVLPLRWHSAYALWWAERLRPSAVRVIAPLSVAMGAGLVFAAV